MTVISLALLKEMVPGAKPFLKPKFIQYDTSNPFKICNLIMSKRIQSNRRQWFFIHKRVQLRDFPI